MITALMLSFSAGALLQFFVSYCRTILATYSKVEVSAKTREIAGIESARISGAEFSRLLGLLRLAQDTGDDGVELFTVRLYYALVKAIGRLGQLFTPAAGDWSEREGSRCAYFAAVALDRRITSVSQ